MEPWQTDREFAKTYLGDIRYWAWQWMYSQPVKEEAVKQEKTEAEVKEEWESCSYLLPKTKR
jgi:hypothetical protein